MVIPAPLAKNTKHAWARVAQEQQLRRNQETAQMKTEVSPTVRAPIHRMEETELAAQLPVAVRMQLEERKEMHVRQLHSNQPALLLSARAQPHKGNTVMWHLIAILRVLLLIAQTPVRALKHIKHRNTTNHVRGRSILHLNTETHNHQATTLILILGLLLLLTGSNPQPVHDRELNEPTAITIRPVVHQVHNQHALTRMCSLSAAAVLLRHGHRALAPHPHVLREVMNLHALQEVLQDLHRVEATLHRVVPDLRVVHRAVHQEVPLADQAAALHQVQVAGDNRF